VQVRNVYLGSVYLAGGGAGVRAGLRAVRAEERRHFDAAAVLVCDELFWDLGMEWNWNLVFLESGYRWPRSNLVLGGAALDKHRLRDSKGRVGLIVL